MKSRGVPFWLAAWSAVIALTVAFCSIAPPWPEPPPPVTAAQAQRPPTARPSIAPGAQPTIGAVVQPRPTAAAGPNPAQIAAAPTALPTLSEVTLGSISASPGAVASPAPTPAAVAEVPAQLDITSSNPTVQISDGSLDSELSDKLGPARSASLRSVDQARAQMMSGDVDGSIRALSRALSIDSSNPYAYFYLGRAYFVKNNPQQALTFLQRAALGFGSNPAWLGETYGFEGAAYEASGRTSEAAAAYKRALDTAPNNRMARAGYGRVAPVSYASPGPDNIAPAPWIVNSPPSNNGTNGPIPIPPPPDVAPPLPAPAPSR